MGPSWIWWLVLAVLVVTGVGCIIYFQAARNRYQPTGDELLDRYAVQFLTDLQESLEHPTRFDESGHFPERYDKHSAMLLESWEDEYGADPRYWQLRAQAAKFGGSQHPIVSSGQPLTITRLPELIDGGMTDEGLFALVDYRKLYEADSEKALELIHRASELYGENAHFHYLQAALELKAGKPAAAWEALARGNGAPRNDPPAIYPVSPACVDPGLFRGSRDSRAFYMAWITNYEVFNEAYTIQLLKDFLEITFEGYPQTLTPERLDQLLLMSYRCTKRSDKPVLRIALGYWSVKQIVDSDPVVRLAELSGHDDERLDLLDRVSSAKKKHQQRLNETISQGDVATQNGQENWDIEFERHLGNGDFLDAEIYPLLEPLGEPVFTTWATEAGLDPSLPMQ